MDDTTLGALHAAFEASPDNAPLLGVLLRAYLDLDRGAEAWRFLQGWEATRLASDADRRSAARVALAADRPEALAFAASIGASVKDGILVDTAAPHSADPVVVPIGGRPKLRVLSNDDTTVSDLQRLLEPETRPIRFEDVGGLDALKEQIRRKIILPFVKPGLFERFKKRVGGGILMYGPPGCGKTMLARATAGECDARFFNIAISDILDMYVGESEQKLHAIFEEARQSKPSILFFDEIEALGGKRQYGRESTTAKLVSQFLSEMDGLSARNQGVLVLGATNVPWAVDSAFRRPGRFDRVQFVPPPDRAGRRAILELQLRERPMAADLRLDDLAARTSGFSGADLQHLVETATDLAISDTIGAHEEVPIRHAHLERALGEVKPTTVEWLSTARNYARYANEAGQYNDVLEFISKHGVVK